MSEPEQSPFYQGQLDVFCAPYAVINALRLLHGIRPLEGRRLLHEALLDVARDLDAFQAVLEQRTDYVAWIDALLERQVRQGGLRVEKPFASAPKPDVCSGNAGVGAYFASRLSSAFSGEAAARRAVLPDAEEVWRVLTGWLAGGSRRCVLFQFIRYLSMGDGFVRHWTCCRAVEGNELVLYDCSREPGSLHRIPRSRLITSEAGRKPERVLLPPHTLRLVRARLD